MNSIYKRLQEALSDKLTKYKTYTNCGKKTYTEGILDAKSIVKSFFNNEFKKEENLDLMYEKAKKYDEKETPKKVKPFSNSFYIKICPNCSSTLETRRNYCDECGQKLDWSDEDE